MKTVIKILQENFQKWEASEDSGVATIKTDKPISDDLKRQIEESAARLGGNFVKIVYETLEE